jgi:predicted  nucleic acid-binding Zn-ribbon protein
MAMAKCGQIETENEQLKDKVQKLEKEVNRLKGILTAVQIFVEGNAQKAQKKMLAGGLPKGAYHRYEGNIETSNEVASIVGAKQTPIKKKHKKKLFGWGF